GDSRGSDPLVPDARVLSGGAYGVGETRLGRWTVTAGGRYDLRHLEAFETPSLALGIQSRDFHEWSGGLGASARLRPSLEVSVDMGRAWRAPTLLELYARGALPGQDRYLIGNRH